MPNPNQRYTAATKHRVHFRISSGLVAFTTLAFLSAFIVPPTRVLAAPGTLPVRTSIGAAPAGYLSLGDSLAFGYDPHLSPWTVSDFSGYADIVARRLNVTLYNPSCPGETTQSFLGAKNAPDNGCTLYRTFFPLHAWYIGPQMGYANIYTWLSGWNTSLVTLQLGANNYWLLRKSCSGSETCIASALPAMQKQVFSDLNAIILQIRSVGYWGKIILVNYFSTGKDIDPITADIRSLNFAIVASALQNDVSVADVFAAFKTASAGQPCAKGLLLVNSDGSCDVHPTAAGHAIIAATILAVMGIAAATNPSTPPHSAKT